MVKRTKNKQRRQKVPSGVRAVKNPLPRGRPIQEPKEVMPRTTSSVIAALSDPVQSIDKGNNYAVSRFDPFSSRGSVSIPDGQNTNFLTTDQMVNNNITVGNSTGFVIQTMAALPCAAIISPVAGTSFQVDGVTVAPTTPATSFGVTLNHSWYPVSVPPIYNITPFNSPGVQQDDVYLSTKGRAVAFGYRLIYTGPANTCAGSIVVTPNDISFSPIGTSTATGGTAGLITTDLTVPTNLVTNTVATPIGTPILAADIRASMSAITRDSKTFRPEQGVVIVPRHHSSNYGIQPVVDIPYVVMAEAAPAAGTNNYSMIMMNALTQGTSTYQGGIIYYDNDWENFQISVTGANSDATYRWETVILMEFNPSSTSAFQPFTSKTANENKSLMSKTNKALDATSAVSAYTAPTLASSVIPGRQRSDGRYNIPLHPIFVT